MTDPIYTIGQVVMYEDNGITYHDQIIRMQYSQGNWNYAITNDILLLESFIKVIGEEKKEECNFIECKQCKKGSWAEEEKKEEESIEENYKKIMGKLLYGDGYKKEEHKYNCHVCKKGIDGLRHRTTTPWKEDIEGRKYCGDCPVEQRIRKELKNMNPEGLELAPLKAGKGCEEKEEEDNSWTIQRLRDIAEIWIGMDGHGGMMTAHEAYLEHKLKEMYDEVQDLIKVITSEEKEEIKKCNVCGSVDYSKCY